MTPLRPSRNSFHNMLQKVSTAPVGTPSERVKLRPRLCAALNMAKYARKMNDDPSIRKTWSPFFSLRGATAVDMGPAYVWRRPRHTTPRPVRKAYRWFEATRGSAGAARRRVGFPDKVGCQQRLCRGCYGSAELSIRLS